MALRLLSQQAHATTMSRRRPRCTFRLCYSYGETGSAFADFGEAGIFFTTEGITWFADFSAG
jgi:hypothetical protein